MNRNPDIEQLKKAHAAQIDRLLEENARLRQALEGVIDSDLFGVPMSKVSPVRRLARNVVPDRFHPAIARFLKRQP
jgi:hypothetical protein